MPTFHAAMWTYLDSPTALLARELGAVPKFPPERPRRVMLPVPRELAFATWNKEEGKMLETETCHDSSTAVLARELGSVPKFPPERRRRVIFPVPKKPAIATCSREEEHNDEAESCPVCTCKRRRWTDSLTDLDKVLLGVE